MLVRMAGIVFFSMMVAAAGAFAEPSSYTVDPVHSFVVFKVKHGNFGYALGRFNNNSGEFVLDEEDAANNKVDLIIDATSIDTDNEARDNHLRSADFFDAAKFPVITFSSKEFKPTGENKFDVTGDLTLHGVTKETTITVEKVGEGDDGRGNYRAGFYADFTIKRSDYGMDKMIGPVGDEITLMVAVEGIRQ